MKTIGSHPGAILFRLGVMVIIILILIIVFLDYFDDTRLEVERASILQTKKIIDSSLAVVFATHAVNGRLDDLNELDGANPFEFLAEYRLVPPGYQGVIEQELSADLEPGWYYLRHRNRVAYKARFLDRDSYFRIVLTYDDLDQSGRFEARSDKFRSLQFVRVAQLPRSG